MRVLFIRQNARFARPRRRNGCQHQEYKTKTKANAKKHEGQGHLRFALIVGLFAGHHGVSRLVCRQVSSATSPSGVGAVRACARHPSHDVDRNVSIIYRSQSLFFDFQRPFIAKRSAVFF